MHINEITTSITLTDYLETINYTKDVSFLFSLVDAFLNCLTLSLRLHPCISILLIVFFKRLGGAARLCIGSEIQGRGWRRGRVFVQYGSACVRESVG